MSAVNVTEVVTRLIDIGVSEDDAQTQISAIGLTIDSFTPSLALRAATLRSATVSVAVELNRGVPAKGDPCTRTTAAASAMAL